VPRTSKRTDAAASVALFGIILVVSVALATLTDIPVVARGAIAIVAGIVAAAVTFSVVRRRTRA